jgi:hypothetical protein
MRRRDTSIRRNREAARGAVEISLLMCEIPTLA